MNILVMGATGMLGSMVYDYFKRDSELTVFGTSRKKMGDYLYFDLYDDIHSWEWVKIDVDYVINCIGITKPYCHDDNMSEVKNAIYVNSLFPRKLDDLAATKDFRVIQIATDCVYSGNKGNYKEGDPHDSLDVYGKTKSLGEVKSKLFLNIRCSIIGPEKFNKKFLLEWFLSQQNNTVINGFTHHLWNGVTTLQFAQLCKTIIKNKQFDALVEESNIHHFTPNNTVSKYELMQLFEEIYKRGVIINKYDGDIILDRTLQTKFNSINSMFPSSTIKDALIELGSYINEKDFYSA